MQHICFECRVSLAGEDTYRTIYDDFVCGNCVELYVLCDYCGVALREHQAYYVEDSPFCEPCFFRDYFFCDGCEEVCERDSGYFRDGLWCENCYRRRSVIQPYHHTQARVFCSVNGEPKRYYGVELEVEVDDNKYEVAEKFARYLAKREVAHYFDLKEDSSLGNGFEIVAQPATIYFHKKVIKWRDILCFLAEIGCTNKASCGLHIHTSRKAISDQDADKILQFFAASEAQIRKLSRRRTFYYCEFNHARLWKWPRSSNQERRRLLPQLREVDRRSALNFHNKETIELRIFAATLDASQFYAALEFYDAVIDFAKQHSIAIASSQQAWQAFIAFVAQRAEYVHLNNYISSLKI